MVSPVTVTGLPVPVAVCPPLPGVVWSVAVTVYPVTGLPPSLAGGVNDTDADALPAVADPITGAPGTVNGVITDTVPSPSLAT